MLQKEVKILLLSLLVTSGLIGIGLWLFIPYLPKNIGMKPSEDNGINNKNQSITERISFGEKIFSPGEISPVKKDGVKGVAAKNYDQAIANFTASLKLKPNDPEALIYLNNARIGYGKSYTIVASLPLGTDPNAALEILRGIAQAQNEINTAGKINGVSLKVGIANDDDNLEISKQIATNLVKNSEVLGVVGPNASDTTLAAGAVYTSGELVAISPTSTSVKLSNFSPYVFRTVPSDFMAARTLANYMIKTLHKKKAAVFFNSQSNYSQSLKSEFVSSVTLEGGQVVSEFDLSKPDFSAAKSLKQAIVGGTEVLMLASNTETLDKGMQVVQANQKRLTLLGGDDVYSLKTLEVGREQGMGMVIAVPWHIEADSQSDFPKKSRQLWGGDVSWRTALAYDATKAFIAALATNPTRAGIQQTLLSSEFSPAGASGAIRFLPSGDRNAPVQLVKIVPGNRSRVGYDFEPILKK
ncbi:ABC transporter substrate-binding protein [Dolichospermum sp. ST_sed1]|nr:ABC transporter substrate-binding protein [Dolichospermum sp. ST_sed1]MDD1424972.1 ABC transporter substrate-binding protein [Dolichospermum sp. ST_sed9]MDD1433627.1 ABC transporter substrate-binding protein [Dolichospermum sp. ST_sed6]MDD1435308.1 ABC transporter substrate-binding protein [Dolichospermum sp. ST_sed10]MDD1442878.1 ABC transporter substrate-binding protein [Dolichospermum sp. ST_sed3]MDD1448582.1 ABC transporter substrate-binding protein [Dolichospermum sp. ST_sed8]MDD14536